MTQENKHTPAPWLYEIAEEDGEAFYSIRCRSTVGYRTIAGIWGGISDEKKANANLIASAPELLEALENLLPIAEKMIGKTGGVVCALMQAEDAINKAKGLTNDK